MSGMVQRSRFISIAGKEEARSKRIVVPARCSCRIEQKDWWTKISNAGYLNQSSNFLQSYILIRQRQSWTPLPALPTSSSKCATPDRLQQSMVPKFKSVYKIDLFRLDNYRTQRNKMLNNVLAIFITKICISHF